MWPYILLDRLPVLALVVYYTANKLMGRKLLSKRHYKPFKLVSCETSWYRALPQFSPSYSRFRGRLLTYYSPVCRFPIPKGIFSLDLHVWATPPAFTLSQDQTLHTKLLTNFSRDILLLFYIMFYFIAEVIVFYYVKVFIRFPEPMHKINFKEHFYNYL